MWSKGNDDFKIRHGITCTSCYFPESVSYRAMGRSILSLHYILLIYVATEGEIFRVGLYVDDITIASKNEEHLKRFKQPLAKSLM